MLSPHTHTQEGPESGPTETWVLTAASRSDDPRVLTDGPDVLDSSEGAPPGTSPGPHSFGPGGEICVQRGRRVAESSVERSLISRRP